MSKGKSIEVILWSIALPGFGQLLNGRILKGLLFIFLEFLINCRSHLNEAIISSFHGETSLVIAQIDYHWIMFYPCIYMFAIWDAYKDAVVVTSKYAVVPVVSGAYAGTVGIIFSRDALGAVWLGLLGLLISLVLGYMMKVILTNRAPTEG